VKIQYTLQALADLEDIERYYGERAGAATAHNMVLRIMDTLERLIALHPGAGRSRPDLDRNTRSIPVLPYVVFYEITRQRVSILRILHGHRDIRPPLASLLVAVSSPSSV